MQQQAGSLASIRTDPEADAGQTILVSKYRCSHEQAAHLVVHRNDVVHVMINLCLSLRLGELARTASSG